MARRTTNGSTCREYEKKRPSVAAAAKEFGMSRASIHNIPRGDANKTVVLRNNETSRALQYNCFLSLR